MIRNKDKHKDRSPGVQKGVGEDDLHGHWFVPCFCVGPPSFADPPGQADLLPCSPPQSQNRCCIWHDVCIDNGEFSKPTAIGGASRTGQRHEERQQRRTLAHHPNKSWEKPGSRGSEPRRPAEAGLLEPAAQVSAFRLAFRPRKR